MPKRWARGIEIIMNRQQIDPRIEELEYRYNGSEYIVKIYKLEYSSIFIILISNQKGKKYHIIMVDGDNIIPLESETQEISRKIFIALGGTIKEGDLKLKRPQSVQSNEIEVICRAIEQYIKSLISSNNKN